MRIVLVARAENKYVLDLSRVVAQELGKVTGPFTTGGI